MVICLNQDYESQLPLLQYLGITKEQCQAKCMTKIEEEKLNFRNPQTTTIGAPDKILITYLEKVITILKKYPKEIASYLPAMIESFVNLVDKSLRDPEGIDQKFTRADGIDVKCLKSMLETIKSGEMSKELTQH